MGTKSSHGLEEKPNHGNQNLKRLGELCRVLAAESRTIDSLYESGLRPEGNTLKKLRKPSWFRGKLRQLDSKGEVTHTLNGSSEVKGVNKRQLVGWCITTTSRHQRLINHEFCKNLNFPPENFQTNLWKSGGAKVPSSFLKSVEGACVYESGRAEATCSSKGREDTSMTKLQPKGAVNEADVDACTVNKANVRPCAVTSKQPFSACSISTLSAYMVATFSSFDAVYSMVCGESKEMQTLWRSKSTCTNLQLSRDLNVLQPKSRSGALSVFSENLNSVPRCGFQGNPVTDWVSRPEEPLVLQSEMTSNDSSDNCVTKLRETSCVRRPSAVTRKFSDGHTTKSRGTKGNSRLSSVRNTCVKGREPPSVQSKHPHSRQLQGPKRAKGKLVMKEREKKKPLRSVRLLTNASAVLAQNENKMGFRTQRTPLVIKKKYSTEGKKPFKSKTATRETLSKEKSKPSTVQKHSTCPQHTEKTKSEAQASLFSGDSRSNHNPNSSGRSKVSNVSRTKVKKRQMEEMLPAGKSKKRCVQNECSTKEKSILQHHQHLCAPVSTSSPFSSFTASDDVFAQLCQLEEKSKQYDKTMLYSLMPWSQKTSRDLYRRTSQTLKEQELQGVSHVGGVWKSIFSEN